MRAVRASDRPPRIGRPFPLPKSTAQHYLAFFLGPLHGQFFGVEPARNQQLAVAEDLGLDAITEARDSAAASTLTVPQRLDRGLRGRLGEALQEFIVWIHRADCTSLSSARRAGDSAVCADSSCSVDIKALAERRLHGSGTLSGRVRHMMVEHLGEATLTPETVARTLAVSGRTLSRHLADEGTSFRNILDDVRREFACTLLRDRSLSISDVAFFLQYSEPAAFNRSFRRWTGRTPRAFRQS